MITVIGQCIGSGDEPQTRRMAKKLMMITYAVIASTCLVTIACTPLILKIYSVSAEALALGMTLIMDSQRLRGSSCGRPRLPCRISCVRRMT